METCNVSFNQQNLWVREQDWDSGTSLVFSLLTFRMKFLEDSNMHTTLEADPEQGSRAMEGKGVRKSLFFLFFGTSPNLPRTSHPSLCARFLPPHPTLLFAIHQQVREPHMRLWHILGFSGHQAHPRA